MSNSLAVSWWWVVYLKLEVGQRRGKVGGWRGRFLTLKWVTWLFHVESESIPATQFLFPYSDGTYHETIPRIAQRDTPSDIS